MKVNREQFLAAAILFASTTGCGKLTDRMKSSIGVTADPDSNAAEPVTGAGLGIDKNTTGSNGISPSTPGGVTKSNPVNAKQPAPPTPKLTTKAVGPSNENIAPANENVAPSKEAVGPSKEGWGPSREVAGPTREHWGPSRENVGPSRENVGPSRENVGPSNERAFVRPRPAGSGTRPAAPPKPKVASR